MRNITLYLLPLFLLLIFVPQALATHEVSFNVPFANHIQLKLPEQDVFIQSKDDKSKVVRVEGEEANAPETLKTPVYASKTETPHDPFKVGENPLGPFDKGKTLGFTLGDWLGGTGSGSYSVTGNSAQMDLAFSALVANGVYTVWCSRITLPPNVSVVDKPCGKDDGSQNSFKADAKGSGKFKLTLSPLPDSTAETVSVIALAYHSDGKTYGADPGKFGLNSHVQLAYLMPAPEAATSPSPTATGVSGNKIPGGTPLIIIVVAGAALAIWYFWKKSTSKPGEEAKPPESSEVEQKPKE